MAVIVKGMDMPESCEDCRFCVPFSAGTNICCASNQEMDVTHLFLVRHDECPLEEIVIGIDLANGRDMTGGI